MSKATKIVLGTLAASTVLSIVTILSYVSV